ncbi:MAG: ABC transporter permease, partial [Gammaproteobacteria bacterium]|nr:ABC transporter permease [Gammaproteobacteria bacterium]
DGDDSFLDAHSNEYGTFYLGTDYLGRDTFSRIIWGARMTIGISLASTILAYLIGITLGIAAAVKGGWVDMGISRVNDAILALPSIMLGLIAIAAFGSSIPILVIIAGIIYASSVFRIARALGLDIMVQDYVEAAKVRGEGLWWIIKSEVLPNAAMPLATDFGLRLVFVVLFISSLSFLGLGVQPPQADWGSMVRENLAGLTYNSWAAVWPAFAIATFTIAINLIVDDISAKSGGSLAKKMV